MDALLHTILRNYTGVFSDDVYIDESLLSVRLDKERQEVYDMLVTLSKMRYIRYVPRKKTPFIVFTTAREDRKFVSISRTVYEERKTRFEKRIHSMIDYAEETAVCRSRMLLIYFGEDSATDCGCCDVCLKKNETGLSNYEFRKIEGKVKNILHEQGPTRIHELVASIEKGSEEADGAVSDIEGVEEPAAHAIVEKNDKEKMISVIRFLIDSGELILQDDSVSLARELKEPEESEE